LNSTSTPGLCMRADDSNGHISSRYGLAQRSTGSLRQDFEGQSRMQLCSKRTNVVENALVRAPSLLRRSVAAPVSILLQTWDDRRKAQTPPRSIAKRNKCAM